MSSHYIYTPYSVYLTARRVYAALAIPHCLALRGCIHDHSEACHSPFASCVPEYIPCEHFLINAILIGFIWQDSYTTYTRPRSGILVCVQEEAGVHTAYLTGRGDDRLPAPSVSRVVVGWTKPASRSALRKRGCPACPDLLSTHPFPLPCKARTVCI